MKKSHEVWHHQECMPYVPLVYDWGSCCVNRLLKLLSQGFPILELPVPQQSSSSIQTFQVSYVGVNLKPYQYLMCSQYTVCWFWSTLIFNQFMISTCSVSFVLLDLLILPSLPSISCTIAKLWGTDLFQHVLNRKQSNSFFFKEVFLQGFGSWENSESEYTPTSSFRPSIINHIK